MFLLAASLQQWAIEDNKSEKGYENINERKKEKQVKENDLIQK